MECAKAIAVRNANRTNPTLVGRRGPAMRRVLTTALLTCGIAALATVGAGADTTTTTLPTTTSTSVPSTTTTTQPVKAHLEDPFNARALSLYLRSRSDDVTAALFDVRTGKTYLYRAGKPQITASMVKIDILATLLYQEQSKDDEMSKRDIKLSTSMIEDSDNKAAQKLWVQIGQLPALSAFNRLIGFHQSILSWGWGDTFTTPLDQLALLKTILFPNEILDPTSQAFEQGLMQGVIGSERFGIPTAVPPQATVGVKNGWYPETATGWQLNSAGYVHLGRCYYLAVVMTAENPTEQYGLETINQIGHLFWNFESTLSRQPWH
jgi:beta-lactamase class A